MYKISAEDFQNYITLIQYFQSNKKRSIALENYLISIGRAQDTNELMFAMTKFLYESNPKKTISSPKRTK